MIRFRHINSHDCISRGDVAAAAPSVSRPIPAEGAAFSFSAPPALSEQALTLLAVVAAHDRISPAEVVTRAICARAEAIGIANLTLQGALRPLDGLGAQDEGAPATSHNPESEKGPEGAPGKGVLRVPPVPP